MAMSDDKNNHPQRSYVSRSQIMSMSPLRQHGIDFQREEHLRRRYIRFIRELGITLRLPQHPTIATATVLCHRFFMQQSHSLNDSLLIASACLFLATKSEDSPCTLSRIVAAYRRLCGSYVPPTPSPTTTSHSLPFPHQQLLHAKFLVLTTIAVDLIVDHPYKPLLFAINKLKHFQKAGEKALLQVAWNFVNDSLRTSLSLQFEPHVIAAATLWLAAKFLDVKLPSQGERVWWRELDVTPCQLQEVGNQILKVCKAVESDTKTSE
ncbi:hypothetical protein L7F22_018046 [Adiantum nelumboides]|nr:hypothetical protein [Adiantum nelumboides]